MGITNKLLNDRFREATKTKGHAICQNEGIRRSKKACQGGSSETVKEINLDYWLLGLGILIIGFLTIAELWKTT